MKDSNIQMKKSVIKLMFGPMEGWPIEFQLAKDKLPYDFVYFDIQAKEPMIVYDLTDYVRKTKCKYLHRYEFDKVKNYYIWKGYFITCKQKQA